MLIHPPSLPPSRPPQGTFGTTYAAEYLGMPVSATVLSINTSDPMAAVWSAASAKLLRRSGTSELRVLASLVPPHRRLARTHGNESVSAQVPLRVVNSSSGSGGGEDRGGDGKEGPAALVLVGEMVEGGSLRARVKAAEESALSGKSADEEAGEGGPAAPEAAAAQPLLWRRKVLADIAEGLAYLHDRGVAHGGLTTENVLLDAEGRAKVRAAAAVVAAARSGCCCCCCV